MRANVVRNPSRRTMCSLAVAHPLKYPISIPQKSVKIQFILPNIPLDVHECGDEDSPRVVLVDSELAFLSGS